MTKKTLSPIQLELAQARDARIVHLERMLFLNRDDFLQYWNYAMLFPA